MLQSHSTDACRQGRLSKVILRDLIDNPWHSRPLDVHRWSEHPEAIALSRGLWAEFFPEFAGEGQRTGPKPKTSFHNQFMVLFLDLYLAWKEDPELCLGVPMGMNAWSTNSRYNALHLSKNMVPVIKRLHEADLIELANGSYSAPNAPTNRTTRIRASELLTDRFQKVDLLAPSIIHHPDRETVILKDGDERTGRDRPVEYEDTEQTVQMRTTLLGYNALLSRTFIDIPTLDNPFVERPITSGPNSGQVDRVSVLPNRTFVRRVFSRGSWSMNGRFYGGGWQQVNSASRAQIFLNDRPTIEVDYRGLHIAILSFEEGVSLVGDPYALPDGLLEGVAAGDQRALVKKLILTAINAPNVRSAYGAFRNEWPDGHPAKGLTNQQLSILLDAFVDTHPHLESKLGCDQGIRLMNVDSHMAAQIIDKSTQEDIPILSVHDSFIVPQDQAEQIKHRMLEVASRVVGTQLEISTAGEVAEGERTAGYLERWEAFQQWLGG